MTITLYRKYQFMAHRLLGFADGENLVLRYQDAVHNGSKPNKSVIHIKDELVWHPEITKNLWANITRISFYQTVVGDQTKIDQLRENICGVEYEYDPDEPTNKTDIGFRGTLFPRVFKKERRTSKTKSVDINLTVDMMRHARDSQFDVLLLLSGDGDYLPLVDEIAKNGKQIWVAAFSKGLNRDLRFAADEFFDLDEYFFEHEQT
jgi:uncharacterized LabA/DUF88 family protein